MYWSALSHHQLHAVLWTRNTNFNMPMWQNCSSWNGRTEARPWYSPPCLSQTICTQQYFTIYTYCQFLRSQTPTCVTNMIHILQQTYWQTCHLLVLLWPIATNGNRYGGENMMQIDSEEHISCLPRQWISAMPMPKLSTYHHQAQVESIHISGNNIAAI